MSNPFFKHKSNLLNNESELYRMATDEIVEIHGVEFNYVTKDLVNPDYIFGEDNLKNYNSNRTVTFYIENYENYDGVGDMFSKFGFEIDNKLILLIERKRLESIIEQEPEIDDLIFHQHSNKIFKVSHIEHDESFYQFHGGQARYRITCELFTPSFEDFNTDIEEIDKLTNETDSNNDLEKNQFDTDEVDILDFNEADIFGNL